MKFKHSKPSYVELDMTPMIDMTFQLIAFFMIVINFDQSQADERVKLPADLLARPPIAPPAYEVVVNMGFLRNESGAKIDPKPYVFYNDNILPVAEMRAPLQREREFIVRARSQDELQDVTVSIRADGDFPTGQVQELIKMSQEVGFSKFSLKAKAGEEE